MRNDMQRLYMYKYLLLHTHTTCINKKHNFYVTIHVGLHIHTKAFMMPGAFPFQINLHRSHVTLLLWLTVVDTSILHTVTRRVPLLSKPDCYQIQSLRLELRAICIPILCKHLLSLVFCLCGLGFVNQMNQLGETYFSGLFLLSQKSLKLLVLLESPDFSLSPHIKKE